MPVTLPPWTALPFVTLVLAMACLPFLLPRLWQRHTFLTGLALACALPVVAFLTQRGLSAELGHSAVSYATFIITLGALYVAAGGVFVDADLKATPAVNVGFLVVGCLLASVIGTTGASVLLIRPFLRTNQQRKHTRHLVPFFILAVANAGGLLTPLGDPPLLLGFVEGVPFFWTLKLAPFWLLYNASFAVGLYVVDRHAYAKEAAADLARDEVEQAPLSIRGKRNLALLAAIAGAALLPPVFREVLLASLALLSYLATPRDLRALNQFSLAPFAEVALLFAGLFVCLVPIEAMLTQLAPQLPLQRSYQLFWASGACSALLDNAPSYAAFAALARGLSLGQPELVAGITQSKLMAISLGSVVMGATTYIGNGPNLIVKSLAERAGVAMPGFFRYALFALLAMLPAHLLTTLALWLLES